MPRVTRERDLHVDQLVFSVEVNVASNAEWDRMFREVAVGDLRFRQRTQVRRWGRAPEIRVPGLEATDLEAWTRWVDATVAATNETYERRVLPHLDRERLAELAREEQMREALLQARRVAASLAPPSAAVAVERPVADHAPDQQALIAAFDAGLIDELEISAG